MTIGEHHELAIGVTALKAICLALIDDGSKGKPGSPPKDPADRIIATTGRAYGLTIVTPDGELLP